MSDVQHRPFAGGSTVGSSAAASATATAASAVIDAEPVRRTVVTVPDSMAVPGFGAALRRRAADSYELTKPRLSFLVLFTVAVGFVAGSGGAVAAGALAATLFGVLAVTASGAILNQVLEVEADRRMNRTSDRPLASGRMSAAEGIVLGGSAGIAGLALLFAVVNPLTALLALTSLVVYVAIYTPLKRMTPKNTLVGAVAGALPPVMGWAGATGEIAAGAVALFALQFVWQIPHFLAIAWLYRDDYARAGFRMLSVGDPGGRRTMFQVRLFSVLLVPLGILPWWLGVAGPAYLAAAVLLGLAFLGCALRTAKSRSLDSARSLFLASVLYLPMLFGALMLDRWV